MTEQMDSREYKVRLAFALNIAAGLATCIGGLVTFHKKLVSLANPSSIGIALGLSAGVMIFISLAEIFGESVDSFKEGFSGNKTDTYGNKTEDCDTICKGHSKALSTVSFIIGAAIIFLLDLIVHKISPDMKHDLEIEELNALRQIHTQPGPENRIDAVATQNRQRAITRQALNRTGILTAVAIAIHNLPEGVATFTGTMKEPKLGKVLAIGIALHNIPEGIAVATQVYFATGSRLKGLFYTFISALAEPFGGFLTWLIIKDGLNPYINGTMFGLVVGMMVTLSIKELIPTALRFCPSKGKVTISILVGMCVMALSLILMDYAGV